MGHICGLSDGMETDDAVQNLRLDTLESSVKALIENQATMQQSITELVTQSKTLQMLVKSLGGVILAGLGVGGAAVGMA